MSLCVVSGCVYCPLLVLDVTFWFCKANLGCAGAVKRGHLLICQVNSPGSRARTKASGQPLCLAPQSSCHQQGVGCGGLSPRHLPPSPFPHHAPAELSLGNPAEQGVSLPCRAWCACAGTYLAYLDAGITRNANPFLVSRQKRPPGRWPPVGAAGLLTQSRHPEDPTLRRHCWHPPGQGAKSLQGAKTCASLPLHVSLLPESGFTP